MYILTCTHTESLITHSSYQQVTVKESGSVDEDSNSVVDSDETVSEGEEKDIITDTNESQVRDNLE